MAPQPIIIAVIGPKGSGKTNFINKLTGIREEAALQEHPQKIREFIVNVSKDRQYVFVDTPTLEGYDRQDGWKLDDIAKWLQEKYGRRVNLSGIICTQEITYIWARTCESVCSNRDKLAQLCGKSSANGVRLVTTMWDKVNKKSKESSVAELEQKFWKPLIEAGARHKRFEDNSSRSAWAIIEDLTGRGEVSLLQDKLVDAGWKFNETRAGEALGKQFWELRWKQRDTIKQLGEEAKRQTHPELVKYLQAEQRHLETELKTMEDATKQLETPFFKSIVLFSDKTRFDSGVTVAKNDYVIL
ncbi:hypothetical protein PISMIDRAFT_330152 [Pisolithus microcarpus 441]|uniref:G domain-containing protein n=1 Tax=Pisolithus microcarpus 441 TaxID=765257 RepID=A0A0C9YEZ0_9AGAM|nr:hypothetical protein BKA83DRAFT_330152 [Pisolithus microcarpus]KIK15176.1 hypothetical protein PISMIDRAFT_330152 [Pisolithus microcarpus 441]